MREAEGVARRRTYSTDAVVEAAKDTFWRLGYNGAAISDLEKATGLSRSSLYQAFTSKQHLFSEALDAYIRGFVAPLLAPMESTAADIDAAVAFIRRLAELFEADGLPRRYGCLWINAISDLKGRNGSRVDSRSEEFWHRLTDAYANALRELSMNGRHGPMATEGCARLLAASTVGCWLTVRIDPEHAVEGCHAMLREIALWRGLAQPAA